MPKSGEDGNPRLSAGALRSGGAPHTRQDTFNFMFNGFPRPSYPDATC